ncbi:MAG: gliding motility-associated C-terminal domain-containing protein [Bacteroidia bacterium]
MYKRFLFTTILLFSISSGFSQIGNFMSAAGAGGIDECNDIVTANNRVFSTGYYTEECYFGINLMDHFGFDEGYVACQDNSGNYLWALGFNGPLSDRGMVIARSNDGFIYVAGIFQELLSLANLQTSSVNGSQDIFVAKIDNNGNAIWLNSYGGEGVETISGIGCTPDNKIWISGQFFGETEFGSFITGSSSNLLNQENIIGLDAFLVKLNNNGLVVDGIKISSPENDRLTNLAVDQAGNAFLAVQGIQTLTVNNSLIDLGSQTSWALLKIAPAMNLLWSKRISSAVIDLKSVDVRSNQVAFAGEFSAPVSFPGDTSGYPTLNPVNTNNIFGVFCQNSTGNYLAHFQESSGSLLSLEDISYNSFGNLWVTGRFGCTFESMNSTNESGLFNSLGYDDIYVGCYQTNGSNVRIYKQHLGGHGIDDVNCIVSKGLVNPVLGGSFEDKLFFQKSPTWDFAGSNQLNTNTNFCNQPNYGVTGAIESYGNKDCFTASIIDNSLPVLDIYDRSGQVGCFKNQVRPSIIPSTDSLFSCDPIELDVDTNLAGFYKEGYNVSYYMQGSPGSVSSADQPGTYIVRISSSDGCRVLRDSVYLDVYPNNGPPEIGVIGGNLIQSVNDGCKNKISKMLGDTLLAYGENYPGDSLTWTLYPWDNSGSVVLSTNEDSVYVIDGGIYIFKRITPEGCVFENCLATTVFSTGNCIEGISPPEFNFEYFVFDQPLDTITVCNGELVEFVFDDSLNFYNNQFQIFSTAQWSIEGQGVLFPTVDDNDDPIPPYSSNEHYNFARFTQSTMISVSTVVLRPISYVDTIFYFQKNIYVQIREPENITVDFIPDVGYICPGDTINVSFTVSPWDVPYDVLVRNNVVNPDSFDFSFFSQSSITIRMDSTYIKQNCLDPGFFDYPIRFKPTPKITMIPANGFKCPEEEIALIPEPGTEHIWNGPTYAEYPADTLYSLYPGFYYYRFRDTTDCPLVSKKALVRNINAVLPDNIISDTICGNAPAIIKLDSDSFMVWTWQPPLSGGDTLKPIFQSGNYTVTFEMCALTDTFNFDVLAGLGSAQLQFDGPSALCPGDTTYLSANPNAFIYDWSIPSFDGEQSIMITQGGVISVTVIDSLDCSAFAQVNVVMNPNPPEPEFIHLPACPGIPIEVTSDSPVQIHWSTEEDGTELEFSNSITVDVTQNLQPIGGYAENTSTGCISEWVGTSLLLNSMSVYPSIPESFIFCSGDSLTLIPDGAVGISQGVWSGPNQLNQTSFDLEFFGIQSDQAGTYTFEAVMDSGYCTIELPIFTTLIERFLDEPIIFEPDSLCSGQEISINTLQTSDYNYTWTGPQSSGSGLQHIVSPSNTGDSGYYTLTSRDSNCVRSDSVLVFVSAIPPDVPLISSALNICIGDTLFLYNADSLNTFNANISWFGPDVLETSGDNIAFIPGFQADMLPSLGLQYGINMCLSSITNPTLEIQPYPVYAFLFPNIEFCEGDVYKIESPIEAYSYQWSTGSSTASTLVYESEIVYLTVFDEFGCHYTDSIIVDAITCDLDDTPNAFSPNADGYNDVLSFKVAGGLIYKATIFDRWGKLIQEILGVNYDWDGTNYKGEKVDDGTYFYILDVKMINGETKQLQGTVNIFR